MISALDTHQTVNRLTAAGLTGAQAEALTETIKQATDIDLANIATRTDVAEMRRELAELKAQLVKWLVVAGFAQVAAVLAVLKLFPAAHP